MTSASAAASAIGQHPQPGGLGLGDRRRALAQADAHVDARVLQVQRVGVALGAVADDGHLAALDDRPIGVGLVVDGCGHQLALPFTARTPRLTIELRQRDPAGALQLHDAIAAQQLLEVVELVGWPSSDTVMASVPTARILPSKICHQLHDLAPGRRRRPAPWPAAARARPSGGGRARRSSPRR